MFELVVTVGSSHRHFFSIFIIRCTLLFSLCALENDEHEQCLCMHNDTELGFTKKVIFHKISQDRDHLAFRLLNGLEICCLLLLLVVAVFFILPQLRFVSYSLPLSLTLTRAYTRRMCMHCAYKTAFFALIVARMRRSVK